MARSMGYVLFVCLLLSPSIAAADDVDKTIETFITMVKEKKESQALDFLYGTNPWLEKSSDAITNMKGHFTSASKLVGEFRNHEKLQDIMVGSRFRYISYLVAYDRQPIRYVFEFYRPDDKWRLFSFAFDDDIDEDIEQRAKASLGGK